MLRHPWVGKWVFLSVLQGEQSPGSYRWKEGKPLVALIKWLKTTTATLGQSQTQSSPLSSFLSCQALFLHAKCWLFGSWNSDTHTHAHWHTPTLNLSTKVGGEPRWYTLKPWQAFIKQAKLEDCKHPSMPANQAHPPPSYLLRLQPTDSVSQVCKGRASLQDSEL